MFNQVLHLTAANNTCSDVASSSRKYFKSVEKWIALGEQHPTVAVPQKNIALGFLEPQAFVESGPGTGFVGLLVLVLVC